MTTTARTFRCPTTPSGPADGHQIIGCGQVFDAEPDHEGLIDCGGPEGCGIWFRADEPGVAYTPDPAWRPHAHQTPEWVAAFNARIQAELDAGWRDPFRASDPRAATTLPATSAKPASDPGTALLLGRAS